MAVSSLPQRARPSRVALHARISTSDQTTESQLLDLRRYVQDRGWQVFQEYTDNGISGTKDNRPALNRLVDDARKRRFDVVLVWRFDRFARSTKHLILALEEFRNLGIDFVSYQENIDTSSPLGGAIFNHHLSRGPAGAGLKRARERGKQLGRPRVPVDAARIASLRAQGRSWAAMSQELGVGKWTAQRAYYSLPKNPAGGSPVNG